MLIPRGTNTHLEYLTLIAFPPQKLLQEGASEFPFLNYPVTCVCILGLAEGNDENNLITITIVLTRPGIELSTSLIKMKIVYGMCVCFMCQSTTC
jgi:hypothetical protein